MRSLLLVIRALINDLFSLTSRIKQNFFHWSSCHSKLSCCTSKWQMVAFSLNYCFLRSEYSSSLGTLSWEQSSSQINCFIQIRISLSDLLKIGTFCNLFLSDTIGNRKVGTFLRCTLNCKLLHLATKSIRQNALGML